MKLKMKLILLVNNEEGIILNYDIKLSNMILKL